MRDVRRKRGGFAYAKRSKGHRDADVFKNMDGVYSVLFENISKSPRPPFPKGGH